MVNNNFEEIIKDYLDNYAKENNEFNEKYNNKDKDIKKCCQYIITKVKESGCTAVSDDEVYYLARHFYEEDNLKFDENVKAKVVTPTKSSKNINKSIGGFEPKENYKTNKKNKKNPNQLSLFDDGFFGE